MPSRVDQQDQGGLATSGPLAIEVIYLRRFFRGLLRWGARTGLRRRRLLGARRQFSRLRLAGAVNGGIQATAMNARSCPSRL